MGQLGLVLRHADGAPAQPADLTAITQKLDLWQGEIVSRFQFEHQPVEVHTVCAPDQDGLATRIVSPLLQMHQLAVTLRFPYGTGETITADWQHPAAHTTKCIPLNEPGGRFSRQLDQDHYEVAATWSKGTTITKIATHEYQFQPGESADSLELSLNFAPAKAPTPQAFAATQAASAKHWQQFWSTGGAIDLAGSQDPRWFELERRIVLSQYLTAIQDAAGHPPQETGLTYNTWEGKFHLEMHWWHEAHFALWDRLPLLEASLPYYQQILPRAQGTAQKQGYAGARWPKMTSPSGAESPSPVGPFLVWEEPHPIFYAELCYRQQPQPATLQKYREMVFQTADFLASYPTWDTNTSRYVLGPTLQCAQEIFPKDKTFNPTFELTYFRWALETAQQWRIRLGLPREAKWDDVLQHLARPTVVEGKYAFTESTPDCYTNPKWNADHPTVTAALGLLPGPQIDVATMSRTFDWVMQNWNWPDTWGWDYPMLAMTAARLGQPERAIDALLLDTPKNHWAINGHVYQRPGLTIYLPANGGLLYAIALMAAGWDGAPAKNAPGFPADGRWQVRWENLQTAP
ncbi:MAG TPA: glycoside hydrolase family 65 [Verrucomicrobiae bacterium]